MNPTLQKIIKLPAPLWDWDPQKTDYSDFSPDEQEALISIVREEHLGDLYPGEIDKPLQNASTHAYRILASFLDPAHIPLFIEWLSSPEFIDNYDYPEDVVIFLPLYGSQAVQPCIDAINDQERDEGMRMYLCDVLVRLAEDGVQPDLITDAFATYLSGKHFSRTLNAHIITCLTNLTKDKHLDVIRDCFSENLVDLYMGGGDFEELEIKLGIRKERTTPCPDFAEAEDEARKLAIKKKLGQRPPRSEPIALFIYLLGLYSIDAGLSTPSSIDGYLTAVLLNPTPMPPSDFLPAFWDSEEEYTPAWDNQEDAEFFFTFLMHVYNKIAEDLLSRDFNPLPDLCEEGGAPNYNEWTHGFLRGYHAWKLYEEGKERDCSALEVLILRKIVNLVALEKQAAESGVEPQTNALIEELGESICDLYHTQNEDLEMIPDDPFRIVRTKKAPKIGRNDPCPCGSGLKYKRCCLNKS